MYKNLKKACQKWALISRPLINTSVAPPIVGLFYKTITQAVLLYGCETWVITLPMLQALTGFHHKVASRITNRTPRHRRGGDWVYPPIAKTLQIAKLYPMEEYVRRCQDTLAIYLATRPILALCCDATTSKQHTQHDTAFCSLSRLFRYWTQPLEVLPCTAALLTAITLTNNDVVVPKVTALGSIRISTPT